MKRTKQIAPTVTEVTDTASFITAGTEVDVDILYGYHMGIGLTYGIKKKWHLFNQVAYRETSMAITGNESVSFQTDVGSIDNITSARIGIDVLYRQLTIASGIERRAYFGKSLYFAFQAGINVPIHTDKSIDSRFSLSNLPDDGSLSAF